MKKKMNEGYEYTGQINARENRVCLYTCSYIE